MKKKFLLLFVVLQFVLFAVEAVPAPKYVFLFIGDGMGKPHVDLGRMIYGPLNMDKLPVKGSVSTVNVLKTTTDSAASGTAFACGVKTINGRLGMDADGNPVESCALLAKRQGKKVAILTTVGVNNATPAAFYAHVMGRAENKTIMEQYPEAQFDILAGEGIDGMKKGIKQEDFLSGKAYQLSEVPVENVELSSTAIRVIAKKDEPFFEIKTLAQPVCVYSAGVSDLAKYVAKSIDLMKDNPKGFFMMAEGGHIDHGGHGNDVVTMLNEFIKFDKAIGVALKFYNEHPNDTLIVVSADHNTGGLKLSDKINKDYICITPSQIKIEADKDAEDVILSKMEAKGIKCTEQEKENLHVIFEKTEAAKRKDPIRSFVYKVIDRHSGISWSTRGHTSDEVYLFAIGQSADLFSGKMENSDVGAKLKAFYAEK